MWKRRMFSVLLAVSLATLAPGLPVTADAEEFSLFGVRFGMTEDEVGTKWLALSDGVYASSSPSVRKLVPRFDHEGKLYQISFSVDLPTDDPPYLVSKAFQDVVEAKWGRGEPNLEFTLVINPSGNDVTVSNRTLREAYIEHIREKLSPLFQP